MNLEEATIQNKLAGLRKEYVKANKVQKKVIELKAIPLKLALQNLKERKE